MHALATYSLDAAHYCYDYIQSIRFFFDLQIRDAAALIRFLAKLEEEVYLFYFMKRKAHYLTVINGVMYETQMTGIVLYFEVGSNQQESYLHNTCCGSCVQIQIVMLG